MSKIKMSKALYLLVAVIIVILIVLLAMFYQQMLAILNLTQRPTPTPTPTNQYIATLPLRLTVSDMWAGGTVTGATVKLYKYGTLEEFDTPNELLDASNHNTGVYETTKAVKTGERYWVKVSKSRALYYYDITIPYATTTGQQYHYISLDFYTLGTYAITLQMPNGSTLQSGRIYNLTSDECYPSFTVMIRNTDSDSGVRDFFDPIKSGGIQRETTFIFKTYSTSGTTYEKLRVQNFNLLYQSSNARYYGFKIDPMNLVLDKRPDGTYNKYGGKDLDGIYTFTIQFDCSAFASGDEVKIDFYLYTQDNLDNFRNYGTHLSDAIDLLSSTFTWTLKKPSGG